MYAEGNEESRIQKDVNLDKTITAVNDKINTWEVKISATTEDTKAHSDVVLIIDNGKTVKEEDFANTKTAAISFAESTLSNTDNNTRIAVVEVNGDTRVAIELSGDLESVKSGINGITKSNQGLFLQGAIRKAREILAGSSADKKILSSYLMEI